MSKKDKPLKRLKSKPLDFTYVGFNEYNKGKTSGSRVMFFDVNSNEVIRLHKPHPNNILKEYQLKQIIITLRKIGVI